jgi:hypothetical protein
MTPYILLIICHHSTARVKACKFQTNRFLHETLGSINLPSDELELNTLALYVKPCTLSKKPPDTQEGRKQGNRRVYLLIL